MIIDFHAHPRRDTDIWTRMLRACDEAGVDRMCLSGAGAQWHCWDNDAVEKAVRTYSDRFIGMGFIRLGTDSPEMVDELHRRGFSGLKAQNPLSSYGDRAYYPVYERAQHYGMPFLFHTGIGARFPHEADDIAGGTSSEYMRPVTLDGVARAFPRLNIVMAHIGFPWCAEAAFMTVTHPNVYVDVAGIDRSETAYPGILNFRELFCWHANGFSKVLFGTEGAPENLAWVKEETEAMLRRHSVDEVGIASVMGGTAARLLHLR